MYAFVEELCIFNCIGDISDLSGAAFSLPESFLGVGEDVVGLYIVCKGPGEQASPNFVETVGHGDGPIVAEVGGVSLLVDKDCGATAPALWGVVMLEECLAVEVEEMVCSGGRPFNGFIG